MASGTKLSYAFDDPRRPVPDLALSFQRVELVEGKPELGDLFTLEDFVECCESGGFTNWDGTGYYAFASQDHVLKSNQYANPDRMARGVVDWYWTHVLWYNK